MTTVAMLGYGRFGAALGGMFREIGMAVRAMDPAAEVPAEVRAGSLEELVEGAAFVLVAVPVTEMQGAFAALRPVLRAGQIVVDVGSVKVGPARAMAATFGREIPWVATHPLFGPLSLARGERPLRAVVCPNPLHPEAVRQVAELFQRIGCQILAQDPDAHDRAMALTHALAFFIAKGLIDAGVPEEAPYAPPSFQAIARALEAVRADAGHLFTALHLQNPYAAEARGKLLAALGAAHEGLSGLEQRGQDETGGARGARGEGADERDMKIPDLGAQSPELRETREMIDEIDQEIVALLGRRAQLARRAAQAKAELGHGVRDPAREAQLLAARRSWAAELGLPTPSIDEIFQAILSFSRRVQEPASGGTPTVPQGETR